MYFTFMATESCQGCGALLFQPVAVVIFYVFSSCPHLGVKKLVSSVAAYELVFYYIIMYDLCASVCLLVKVFSTPVLRLVLAQLVLSI